MTNRMRIALIALMTAVAVGVGACVVVARQLDDRHLLAVDGYLHLAHVVGVLGAQTTVFGKY